MHCSIQLILQIQKTFSLNNVLRNQFHQIVSTKIIALNAKIILTLKIVFQFYFILSIIKQAIIRPNQAKKLKKLNGMVTLKIPKIIMSLFRKQQLFIHKCKKPPNKTPKVLFSTFQNRKYRILIRINTKQQIPKLTPKESFRSINEEILKV
ncbi:transmembrane protein, putative (macronuclear) [Tetrahymena thermophila SB210]|uniref:Transmembrane protein, putative n=1 Tax=Tetrahymena thermophila (strain SB210) TaxID=312017 RepID=W7XFI0_TETTS|nr:transmembrane protein, putative [Tetrahymena thermophila SB210]EWS72776.1 transmembrane protein, putative [Tetrahymena thermophila SB210]|eukprot:XP_012654688.1 transmembrane protein, putative [Tetrahymena thermophila SB210]